jgi:hypothetical protein
MLASNVVYKVALDNIEFDGPDDAPPDGTVYSAYTSSNDSLRIESIAKNAAGEIVVTWRGSARLESAPDVNGPWQEVGGAANPFRLKPDFTQRFYRLRR